MVRNIFISKKKAQLDWIKTLFFLLRIYLITVRSMMAFVPVEGHARDTEYPHYIGDLGTFDSQWKGNPLLCQEGCSVQKFILKEQIISFRMLQSTIIFYGYYWGYGLGNDVLSVFMKI